MVHAFVMVKTASGASESLLESILETPLVAEAHIVAGNYDIIAEVDAEAVYDVLEAVSETVVTLDGVLETRTYIAIN